MVAKTQDSTDPEKGPSTQDAPTTVPDTATTPTAELAYTIFSPRIKIFIIIMSSISSLFSPVSSVIYLPALDVLASFYHVSTSRINLSVTTYMILQGLAPMFFGDMADQMGRRPVYILTLSIYLAANVGLALQSNYAALLVLRALQSTGSSGTIALGNAVMADIATPAERSGYISWACDCADDWGAFDAVPELEGVVLVSCDCGWDVFVVLYTVFAGDVSEDCGEWRDSAAELELHHVECLSRLE
jgi:hypothetical protein